MNQQPMMQQPMMQQPQMQQPMMQQPIPQMQQPMYQPQYQQSSGSSAFMIVMVIIIVGIIIFIIMAVVLKPEFMFGSSKTASKPTIPKPAPAINQPVPIQSSQPIQPSSTPTQPIPNYTPSVSQAINGGWSNWGAWGACDKECGGGSQTRKRLCNNPAPAFGGKPCDGSATESQSCNSQPCVVNGGWSPWSEWSEPTNKLCGGSISRTRKCDNPAPSNGGSPCEREKEAISDLTIKSDPRYLLSYSGDAETIRANEQCGIGNLVGKWKPVADTPPIWAINNVNITSPTANRIKLNLYNPVDNTVYGPFYWEGEFPSKDPNNPFITVLGGIFLIGLKFDKEKNIIRIWSDGRFDIKYSKI